MIKIKDLRDLNEEEFKEVYRYLEEETKNFTVIHPKIILKNNQYLLIFRIILGLSQKEFANELERTKDWCRHTESGRNKIEKLKIALRYVGNIQCLFKNHNIESKNVLENWNKYNYYSKNQLLPEPEVKLKPLSKISELELKEYFELIKKETNNFTLFKSELLTRIPQSIVVFRITLGVNHRDFSRMIGSNSKGLRDYEHGKTRIKPITSKKIINVIKELFINKKEIKFDKVLENFRILKGFYGHRNLKSLIKLGLNSFGKLSRSPIEDEIFNILNENKIMCERNEIVEGKNKKYNVDFLIPNKEDPRIIIECFMFKRSVTTHNWKYKVCSTDHRFQALKIKNPKLIAIMVIKFTGRPILLNFVKECVQSELLNTDYLFINEEMVNLPLTIERNKL